MKLLDCFDCSPGVYYMYIRAYMYMYIICIMLQSPFCLCMYMYTLLTIETYASAFTGTPIVPHHYLMMT